MWQTLVKLVETGWHVVKEAHAALWVMGLLGITVPAGVPAWFGWDNPESRAWTVFASVILWGFLFLCALAYVGHRNPPRQAQPTEDFKLSDWTGHATYRVWIASCLWIGMRPDNIIPAHHPAYPTLQKIKSALIAGHINAVYGGTGMEAIVTKEELIRLAESTHERPRFLFPAEASDAKPTYIPIHEAVAHVAQAINDRESCFPRTLLELRQAGLNGNLRMRGRRQLPSRNDYRTLFDDVHQDIPADYWKTSRLSPLSTEAGHDGDVYTMPISPFDWDAKDYTKAGKFYTGIQANWSDLVKLWP